MFQTTFTCVLVNALVVLCLTITQSQSVILDINKMKPPTLAENVKTQSTAALQAINSMLENSTQLVDAMYRRECDNSIGASSAVLKDAVKSLMISLVAKNGNRFSEIKIKDVPSYSNSFADETNITRFKLTNSVVKGVDKLKLSQYNFDTCAMSREFELNIPSLEVTATYELEGNVNGSPISGAGDFSLKIDAMYLYHLMLMDCNPVLFSEDRCMYSKMNSTVNVSAQNVQVNLSGVKYMNLTESEINDGLNAFINVCVKSNKMGLAQKIADEFVTYYSKMAMLTSPVKLLSMLKEDLKNVQQSLARGQPRFYATVAQAFVESIISLIA